MSDLKGSIAADRGSVAGTNFSGRGHGGIRP
jgi:hypothetical protein